MDARLGESASFKPEVIHLHQVDDPAVVERLRESAPVVISAHGYTACTSGVHYFRPGQECTRAHGPGCVPNLAARGCAHTRRPQTLPAAYRRAGRGLAALERADLAVSLLQRRRPSPRRERPSPPGAWSRCSRTMPPAAAPGTPGAGGSCSPVAIVAPKGVGRPDPRRPCGGGRVRDLRGRLAAGSRCGGWRGAWGCSGASTSEGWVGAAGARPGAGERVGRGGAVAVAGAVWAGRHRGAGRRPAGRRQRDGRDRRLAAGRRHRGVGQAGGRRGACARRWRSC